MTLRSLLLILLSVMLAGCSVIIPRPASTPPIITRPVDARESDKPLLSTPGSEYTVTIEGRVTDADTGMTIPDATILMVTVGGSYEFMGGLFQISFPAETVVNIRAKAPGYKTESRQMKAHYKRNVTLDMEIKLERIHTESGVTAMSMYDIDEMVQRILRSQKKPWPTDITDRVFLAIEGNRRDYEAYFRTIREIDAQGKNGQMRVNAHIGQLVRQLTTGVNRGRCNSPRSSLIKSYERH